MLVKNCKIVSSSGIVEGDVLIREGRVEKIGKNLKRDGEVIDAEGRPVIPGLVDAHVHMRDFDEAKKEDYVSGSKAALAGGVTSFLEMPNTSPEINDIETLKRRISLGEEKSLTDFGIHFGLAHSNKDSFKPLDLPSVKVYMDRFGAEFEEAIERFFSIPHLLTCHCEDPRVIKRNAGFNHDETDFLTHSDIREEVAETNAVALVSRLALKHKKKVHLCHLTLPKSISLLNQYTTCEVTPHHLLLTEKDLQKLKGVAKTNPPLRPKLEVYGLWQALKQGKVDVIASDHAPHTHKEKEGDVLSCPSGVPNVEIMLPLMLDLVNRGSLTLTDIVRMMCENPARIFNVRAKGFLRPGADADMVILDMEKEHRIDPDKFHSKAGFSPFAGRPVAGDVKTVLVRGEKAYEDGRFFVKPGYGRYLYRQV